MKLKSRYMRHYLIYILLVIGFDGFSQSLSIETSLDSNKILIGDQVGLTIKVSVPKTKKSFVFPRYSDTLFTQKQIPDTTGNKNRILTASDAVVEIVERTGVDTISKDGNMIVMQQKYIITCFDSGRYQMKVGPFIVDGKDSIFSNPVDLYVNTLPVNSAKDVKDIKSPYKAPLEWAEIWPWLRWVLLGVLLIAIIVYFAIKYFAKQKPEQENKLKEPAHTIAFRDLEKLKTDDLLSKQLVKEYHSRLTDIVRTYIENRYALKAMETTSDELLDEFGKTDFVNPELFNKLKQMLQVADLAKFAKYEPNESENLLSLTYAYEFVEKTIVQDAVVDMEKQEMHNKEDLDKNK